ncbi:MAG: hypothetical protein ACI8Y4_004698 [Candidatus Poriferisodalaceae bacterium]
MPRRQRQWGRSCRNDGGVDGSPGRPQPRWRPARAGSVTGECGWDLDTVEMSTEVVDGDCGVVVGVGIDTHDDLFVWHDFGAPNHQRLEAPTGRNGGQDS